MLPRSSFKSGTAHAMQGFTLIEVLVAISLLAIVMSSVYGVFTAVSRTNDRLESDSAEYHLARVIFDRLGRELHGAYYIDSDSSTRLKGGQDENGNPFLELTTTAVTPLSASGTGIARVSYKLARDPQDKDAGAVLLRGEQPRQMTSAMANEQQMMRLAPGLAGMNLRFFRAGAWREEWQATENGLPQLVEITLIAGHDPKRQVTFRSAFRLPESVAR